MYPTHRVRCTIRSNKHDSSSWSHHDEPLPVFDNADYPKYSELATMCRQRIRALRYGWSATWCLREMRTNAIAEPRSLSPCVSGMRYRGSRERWSPGYVPVRRQKSFHQRMNVRTSPFCMLRSLLFELLKHLTLLTLRSERDPTPLVACCGHLNHCACNGIRCLNAIEVNRSSVFGGIQTLMEMQMSLEKQANQKFLLRKYPICACQSNLVHGTLPALLRKEWRWLTNGVIKSRKGVKKEGDRISGK